MKISKSTMAVVMSLLLLIGIMPTGGFRAYAVNEAVEYIGIENQVNSRTDYTVMTSSTTTLSSGFYVVKEDITITERIKCTGSVSLILCDGATLTDDKGITVLSGNYLSVYGQSQNTGKLNVKADQDNAAGIGVSQVSEQSGKIYLISGNITAEGGNKGPGIGGQSNSDGGRGVFILGANVTATGGANGAGIGGSNGTSGYVEISRGVVNATGGSGAAGIGGGTGSAGTVKIFRGKVTATGGYDPETGYSGAGIGGGCGSKGTVTIVDGEIEAVGGKGAAAIGGGKSIQNGEYAKGNVTISGGIIIARGSTDDSNPIGIGGSEGSLVSFTKGSDVDSIRSVSYSGTVSSDLYFKDADTGDIIAKGDNIDKDLINNKTIIPYTRPYSITWNNYNGSLIQTDTGRIACGLKPESRDSMAYRAPDQQYTYSFSKWDPLVEEIPAGDESYEKTYTAVYTQKARSYKILFNNYDGSKLKDLNCQYGSTPIYNGSTPVKPADEQYTYSFIGWSPAIAPVTGEAAYTAVFSSTSISSSSKSDVEISAATNGTVTANKETAAEGETVILTVVPELGFELSKLTVTDENNVAVATTAFSDGYCFNMPAGKATVTAVFSKLLTPQMVTLEKDTFSYDGRLHRLNYTVKDGNTLLTTDDYTCVSGDSATAAGSYDLILEGKGSYTGTCVVSWKINNYCTITYIDADNNSQEYTVQFGYPTNVFTAATESGGKTFCYWEVGGKPVSYSQSYSFIATKDTTVKAVYGDSPTEKNNILELTAYETQYNGNNAIRFMFDRSIIDTYDVKAVGVRYTTNKKLGYTDNTTDLTAGGTNINVDSLLKGNNADRFRSIESDYKTLNGTFDYSCTVGNYTNAYVYAVGYVTVEKDGVQETFFSNVVAATYNNVTSG